MNDVLAFFRAANWFEFSMYTFAYVLFIGHVSEMSALALIDAIAIILWHRIIARKVPNKA